MMSGSIDFIMDLAVHIRFSVVGEWQYVLIKNNDIGTEKFRGIE